MRPHLAMRRGFTLIEIMISIGLGCVIIAVATDGFQVTSQSLTLANRLSVQNSMLRAGVIAANQELDFWDTFDSRNDPTKQPLRSPGCAFAPMSFTTPDTLLEFDQSDPREWWNGQIWASNDKRFGDYSLFGRQGLSDPAVPAERSWRHRIVPAINAGLGYYALIDYLPANFVYAYYATDGTIPDEFGLAGGGSNHFQTPEYYGRPSCKSGLGKAAGFIVTTTTNVPGLPNTHPTSEHASYSAWVPPFDTSLYVDGWKAFPAVDFRSCLPSAWPQVTMKVKVAYTWMDFRHEVIITQADPLTGQSISLLLHGLTTTLRGARRQRGFDTMPPDPRYQ